MKQYSSFTSGEASAFSGDRLRRAVPGGVARLPVSDPSVTGRHGATGPDLVPNLRSSSIDDQLPFDAAARPGHETLPLPPDASSTLYVEGLPADSTKREVARILFYDVALKSRNDIFLSQLIILHTKKSSCQLFVFLYFPFRYISTFCWI